MLEAVSPRDEERLSRVLEPEVMDTAEEARDYDAMDHTEVNRRFVLDFLAVWNQRNPILDVGTGTAQIPLALCRQSPIPRVTALDAASHMLNLAQRNIERAGLNERITLLIADAKRTTLPSDGYGAIISNSIVHHIPEPRQVFAEMVRVAAPGATLFVRDLLRPENTAQLQQLVQTYAGAANAHQQKMFAESLHAALTLEEVRDMVGELGFAPETVQQTSDRHWTWTAVKR